MNRPLAWLHGFRWTFEIYNAWRQRYTGIYCEVRAWTERGAKKRAGQQVARNNRHFRVKGLTCRGF